jgi:TP901 family phage tail tape measure protein
VATVGRIVVEVDAKTAKFIKSLDTATRRGQKFGTRMTGVGRTVQRSMTRMGASVGRLLSSFGLLAGAGGIALAIRSLGNFEKKLSEIVGLVGLSKQEVEAFRVQLTGLARETGQGPLALAEALFFVTSAGLRGQEAMDVLTASAKAATAGLGDTAVVANAVTAAMNSWGKENLSAARATDILVATVREGQLEASSLGSVIGRVASTAAEMGVSFENVGATIAAMTRAGISADESVTALRSVLLGLVRPSEDARDAMGEVGFSFATLRRVIKEDGLMAGLLALKDAVGHNEDAMFRIFPNIRSLSAIFALLGKNVEVTKGIFERMADVTGIADEAFEAGADTINVRFATAMAGLGGTINDFALPPLTKLVEFLDTNLPDALQIVIDMWQSFYTETTKIARANAGELTIRIAELNSAIAELEAKREGPTRRGIYLEAQITAKMEERIALVERRNALEAEGEQTMLESAAAAERAAVAVGTQITNLARLPDDFGIDAQPFIDNAEARATALRESLAGVRAITAETDAMIDGLLVRADSGFEEFGRSAGFSLQSAFANTFLGIEVSFSGMLRRLAAQMAASALLRAIFTPLAAGGGVFSSIASAILPGLQHGGSFEVAGAGGTDSQIVAFRATPGERVDVTPPGRSMAAAPQVHVEQHNHFDVGLESVQEQILAMTPPIAAATHAAVLKALRRPRMS